MRRNFTQIVISIMFFLTSYLELHAGVYDWYWNNYCCEPECCNPDWNTIDRFTFSAEALYWEATEDGLAFGIKDTNTIATTNFINDSGNATSQQTKAQLDFKWKTGFRVNVEGLLPCERWFLGGNWTYFTNNADGKAFGTDLVSQVPNILEPTVTNDFLVTTFLIPNGFSTTSANIVVNEIDAHWHLDFDNYELYLAKKFCVRCFDFLLHAGVRYLNVEQRYRINYVINEDEENPENRFGTIEQVIKSRFSGVGLQGQVDANWKLGRGVALYTKAGGGLAYGKARIFETLNQVVNVPNDVVLGTQGLFTSLKESDLSSCPNFDFAIGARWKHNFADCVILGFRVGWEYHHYFNQNIFRIAQENDPGRGDLILQGVTFALDLNF